MRTGIGIASGLSSLNGLSSVVLDDFSPLEISGLIQWYKSNIGIYQDSAKTIPVLSDGDVIGAWEDLSGSGNDALQVTTANKPILTTDELNGLPAIQFDSTDDYLEYIPFTMSGEMTIYVVSKTAETVAIWLGDVRPDDQIMFRDDTNMIQVQFNSVNTIVASTGIVQLVYQMVTIIRDGTDDLFAYINAVNRTTGSPSNANPFDLRYIGNLLPLSARRIFICEYLLFDRALPEADRNAIDDYLNERYLIY